MTPTKELLEQIDQQEKELVLDHFSEDDAWRLGCILVEQAQTQHARVAIDIRKPGQILFHAALPGATPNNDDWIRRKSNVVFRFAKSSLAIGVSLALTNTSIEQYSFVSSMEYTPSGGAFPFACKAVA